MNDDASEGSFAIAQDDGEEFQETSNLGGSGSLIRTVMFPFSAGSKASMLTRGPA